jgi:hypothetical protein
MKNIVIILFAIILQSHYLIAQETLNNSNKTNQYTLVNLERNNMLFTNKTTNEYIEIPFAKPTLKKDTLFLVKNDLGYLLCSIWKTDKTYHGKVPVIIMVPKLP